MEFHQPQFGMTPLMWAIARGDPGIVSLILSSKPDLHAVDKDGWTALHYACKKGKEDTVTLLLGQGAKPNIPDIKGRTPLMVAAENGGYENVKRLLQAGADKALPNKEGKTAVMLATDRRGLGGLKIAQIGTNSVCISEGFDYQRNIAAPEFVVRVTDVKDGTIMKFEGKVPIGYESAVGMSWMFDKPGMTLENGDYIYTSLVKDATIKLTK